MSWFRLNVLFWLTMRGKNLLSSNVWSVLLSGAFATLVLLMTMRLQKAGWSLIIWMPISFKVSPCISRTSSTLCIRCIQACMCFRTRWSQAHLAQLHLQLHQQAFQYQRWGAHVVHQKLIRNVECFLIAKLNYHCTPVHLLVSDVMAMVLLHLSFLHPNLNLHCHWCGLRHCCLQQIQMLHWQPLCLDSLEPLQIILASSRYVGCAVFGL